MLLDEDAGCSTGRRILQVCLDTRNAEYDRWQAIEDIHSAAVYANGPANVDPNRWQQLLDRIQAAARADDQSPEIQLLVLASTRERMEKLDPCDLETTLDGEIGLGTLLENMGLATPGYLEAYGSNRSDWRPFGGRVNVVTLFAQLRSDLIAAGAPPFRWKPVESRFWQGGPNDATVTQIMNQLTNQPSVIVIDPLSLYDAKVLSRYRSLMSDEYIYKPYNCLMVLPPCPTDGFWSLQDAVRNLAQEVYDRFYRPVFDEKRVPLASLSALVSHPHDVRRLLAATLRRSRTDFKQWWSVVS
jgi:hypothetical protein